MQVGIEQNDSRFGAAVEARRSTKQLSFYPRSFVRTRDKQRVRRISRRNETKADRDRSLSYVKIGATTFLRYYVSSCEFFPAIASACVFSFICLMFRRNRVILRLIDRAFQNAKKETLRRDSGLAWSSGKQRGEEYRNW